MDWQSCCATLGQRFHTGWESAPGAWIIGIALVLLVCVALLADGALSPRTQGMFNHLFYLSCLTEDHYEVFRGTNVLRCQICLCPMGDIAD